MLLKGKCVGVNERIIVSPSDAYMLRALDGGNVQRQVGVVFVWARVLVEKRKKLGRENAFVQQESVQYANRISSQDSRVALLVLSKATIGDATASFDDDDST